MKKNKLDIINSIFSSFIKDNPEPQTELKFINEYTLLVAIILSAQSTDIGVNKATARLFIKAKTPEEMIELGIDKLKFYINSIGLYNSKAKHIISLSQILINKFQGKVPEKLEELLKLPGVGEKTARVFLNCAHHVPVIAVDTHVFRVSQRLGIVKSRTVKAVEAELNKIIPTRWKIHAHHWLILHGRYICKARKPACLSCKISNYCNFFQSNTNGS